MLLGLPVGYGWVGIIELLLVVLCRIDGWWLALGMLMIGVVCV